MIYKNHNIETVFLPGADFSINEDGLINRRIPSSKHIDYVIVHCLETGLKWHEKSSKEAKITINNFKVIK